MAKKRKKNTKKNNKSIQLYGSRYFKFDGYIFVFGYRIHRQFLDLGYFFSFNYSLVF